MKGFEKFHKNYILWNSCIDFKHFAPKQTYLSFWVIYYPFEVLLCGSGPPWSVLEVMRVQHTAPREPTGGLGNWDPTLPWWLTGGPGTLSCFPLLGRPHLAAGETREPMRDHWGQVRLAGCSHQEGLYLTQTFMLTGGYGGWGTNQVTVAAALCLLLIPNTRLKTRVGWLTSACLLFLVVFHGASVTSR